MVRALPPLHVRWPYPGERSRRPQAPWYANITRRQTNFRSLARALEQGNITAYEAAMIALTNAFERFSETELFPPEIDVRLLLAELLRARRQRRFLGDENNNSQSDQHLRRNITERSNEDTTDMKEGGLHGDSNSREKVFRRENTSGRETNRSNPSTSHPADLSAPGPSTAADLSAPGPSTAAALSAPGPSTAAAHASAPTASEATRLVAHAAQRLGRLCRWEVETSEAGIRSAAPGLEVLMPLRHRPLSEQLVQLTYLPSFATAAGIRSLRISFLPSRHIQVFAPNCSPQSIWLLKKLLTWMDIQHQMAAIVMQPSHAALLHRQRPHPQR